MNGRTRVDTALDRALDELYRVAPDAFVATRKQLVADLRTAGETAAAKELGAARRPTVAAWAVNQVAHREPALVDELLQRSAELRDAQERAVAGDAGDLRDATRAQRDAFDRVFAVATEYAEAGPASAVGTQIGSTLQAASASVEAGELLRQGRLIKELHLTTGFPGGDDSFSAGAPRAPSPTKRPAAAADAEPSEPAAGATVADLQRARERRAARERAERDLEAARSELEQARAAAEAAVAAADEARTRSEALAHEAAVAKDAARQAQQEQTAARRQADRLAAAVARLERALPPPE